MSFFFSWAEFLGWRFFVNQCAGRHTASANGFRVERGIGVHITDELAAMSVSDDCAAVPLENPLTIPFYVFWPVTSESLWPEIRQCIAEIAGSIRAAGIPLTEAGESYLKA